LKIKTKQIHNIILDQTYFSAQIRIPGKGDSLNPYDAPVGALCANFNTITFKWDSREKRFTRGEPQTPLLSIFHGEIKKTNLKKGRVILSKQQSELYPGLLIKHFFEKNNIKVTGSVLKGTFEVNEGEKDSFLSPLKIKEIVKKLLRYSNNFIANQLLLTMGAKVYGQPATLEKGLNAVKLFSKQVLNFDHLIISEGSGLSRSNLVSPDQMLKVLIEFMPFYSLLNSKDNEFFKTGTLSGVRARAGYISKENKKLYPYVIMVNQKNKGYESIRKDILGLVLHNVVNQNKD
ncbi:MAG: D-alanyl-D-alanine carboxypeptidase, partial [Desulfobacula sp.]|uniref:D-alanyl-D-alanine carboxypeptidase n=1 Tax=Desulfobacula sp. TaxID=2593537 RepID=UPI001EBB64E0|nr:D-alanyl-D-alanine carboxypeptidase [Desulfobacula sp.]